VAGPWAGTPTIYEFFVVPDYRGHAFKLFEALMGASGAARINGQTNDPMITVMLHTFAHEITSESILFHDRLTTAMQPAGARFRTAAEADDLGVSQDQLQWHGVVEVDGTIAATGGILFHYNRPYGDIYMEVTDAFRRRGLGAFIVQELKRVCYEGGSVPSARCRPDNAASRLTLQRAGFVPCGNILNGVIRR